MPCDCHNSDAEHEVAMANTKHLKYLRGLELMEEAKAMVNAIFALPGVQEAVYDVEAGELADAIEALGERGEL